MEPFLERLSLEEAETEARLVQTIAEHTPGAVENGPDSEHYESASQEVDSFKDNLSRLSNEDIIGLYEDALDMQGEAMSHDYILVKRVAPTSPLERIFWVACYLDPDRAVLLHEQALGSEREEVKERAHRGAFTLSMIGDDNRAMALWRHVFNPEIASPRFSKDAKTAAGIVLKSIENGSQAFRLSTDATEELRQLSAV